MNTLPRLIEFAVYLDDTQNAVLTLDVEEISFILQYDNSKCQLMLKNGRHYLAFGTHRTLTNRWVYCLEKKREFLQDDVIRPSLLVYHRPENISIDNIYYDLLQMQVFAQCLRPDILTQYSWVFE